MKATAARPKAAPPTMLPLLAAPVYLLTIGAVVDGLTEAGAQVDELETTGAGAQVVAASGVLTETVDQVSFGAGAGAQVSGLGIETAAQLDVVVTTAGAQPAEVVVLMTTGVQVSAGVVLMTTGVQVSAAIAAAAKARMATDFILMVGWLVG